jgi:hypothetical protein
MRAAARAAGSDRYFRLAIIVLAPDRDVLR